MSSNLSGRVIAPLLVGLGVANLAVAVEDGEGRDWRQVTATRGLSLAQVAAACPRDGASFCEGSVGAVDMDEWIWADGGQVLNLFAKYVPGILTAPNNAIVGFDATALSFATDFSLTTSFSSCSGYFGCSAFHEVAGYSSSVDVASGLPIGGTANVSGSISFQVGPLGASGARGYWMFRPTGQNDGSVHAYKDKGTSPSPYGGIAIPNVLANDYVGGVRATPALVSISQVSEAIDGIALNTSDGSVSVATGKAVGTYSLTYQICSLANPAFCDDARATVIVPSFGIAANPDTGRGSFYAGGTFVANVLANDTIGGVRPTTALVSLSQMSSTHAGITLDVNDGSVDVAPGTPTASHSLMYRVCERANPVNCAAATVTLLPNTIVAVYDSFRMSSKVASTSPSVLNNDSFNGSRPTTAQVSITLLGSLPYGVNFNTTTGTFFTRGKVSSGAFYTSYKICEIASPDNCSQTTVTLDLSGKGS